MWNTWWKQQIFRQVFHIFFPNFGKKLEIIKESFSFQKFSFWESEKKGKKQIVFWLFCVLNQKYAIFCENRRKSWKNKKIYVLYFVEQIIENFQQNFLFLNTYLLKKLSVWKKKGKWKKVVFSKELSPVCKKQSWFNCGGEKRPKRVLRKNANSCFLCFWENLFSKLKILGY